jgi:hypothetical protein
VWLWRRWLLLLLLLLMWLARGRRQRPDRDVGRSPQSLGLFLLLPSLVAIHDVPRNSSIVVFGVNVAGVLVDKGELAAKRGGLVGCALVFRHGPSNELVENAFFCKWLVERRKMVAMAAMG